MEKRITLSLEHMEPEDGAKQAYGWIEVIVNEEGIIIDQHQSFDEVEVLEGLALATVGHTWEELDLNCPTKLEEEE